MFVCCCFLAPLPTRPKTRFPERGPCHVRKTNPPDVRECDPSPFHRWAWPNWVAQHGDPNPVSPWGGGGTFYSPGNWEKENAGLLATSSKATPGSFPKPLLTPPTGVVSFCSGTPKNCSCSFGLLLKPRQKNVTSKKTHPQGTGKLRAANVAFSPLPPRPFSSLRSAVRWLDLGMNLHAAAAAAAQDVEDTPRQQHHRAPRAVQWLRSGGK